MKKPILNHFQRAMIRQFPNSSEGSRLQLFIATKKLKRAINNKIVSFFEWFDDCTKIQL